MTLRHRKGGVDNFVTSLEKGCYLLLISKPVCQNLYYIIDFSDISDTELWVEYETEMEQVADQCVD